MKRYKVKILGLDCANCARELEEEIKKCELISDVSINFMMEVLSFECDEDKINDAIGLIKEIVKRCENDVKIEEI